MSGTIVLSALPTFLAHPGFGWGWGWGPGWLIFLFPLFWILVIVIIFAIFGPRWRRRMRQGPGAGYYGGHPHGGVGTEASSAENTLAERFARGEIDDAEYRARLDVLRANRPQGPTPPTPPSPPSS